MCPFTSLPPHNHCIITPIHPHRHPQSTGTFTSHSPSPSPAPPTHQSTHSHTHTMHGPMILMMILKSLSTPKQTHTHTHTHSARQPTMVVYNFKKIQPVPTATDFVDIVLTRTQRKTPTVIHPGYKISRIRSVCVCVCVCVYM